MLSSQKHLFSLPDGLIYLNVAYMAPQLKSVEETGHKSVSQKNNPSGISNTDFYTQRTILKQRFASLVEADDYRNIAIIPSVSYGMANLANNVKLKKGDEILLVNEQFPSNVYIWQKTAAKYGAYYKNHCAAFCISGSWKVMEPSHFRGHQSKNSVGSHASHSLGRRHPV